MLGVGVLSLL